VASWRYGDHGARYEIFYRWLNDHQIACHAVDFRGHGRSQGKRGYVGRSMDGVSRRSRCLLESSTSRRDRCARVLSGSHSRPSIRSNPEQVVLRSSRFEPLRAASNASNDKQFVTIDSDCHELLRDIQRETVFNHVLDFIDAHLANQCPSDGSGLHDCSVLM
jgi:alpha-beta hydrolase superfamily lysophospholipase